MKKNNTFLKSGKAGVILAASILALLTGCAGKGSIADRAGSNMPPETNAAVSGKISGDAYPAADDFNTEEYSSIKENGFQAVATSPLSTFAADVDTASYANIRRMINSGQQPVPDAVRIEEMLNYFRYDYPAPSDSEPFSVTTEIADCPWNPDTKLMLLGMQAKNVDKSEMKPSNLVFLIDVSGSMEDPDKLPLVKNAFLLLCEQLSENDTVSIVTYAGSDRVMLEGESGANSGMIMSAIENLEAGGSTAGSVGIERAYEIASKYYKPDGNNRVILATDGDLNVGVTSEGELTRLIKEKKKSGIYLSVLGFGTGNIKDNKMEALADNGNGNYSYIDSRYEARKVLVEELGGTFFTVAKDVKLQLEFNPKYIKGYRLIGYENRVMDDRDFEDDSKDGGEIGSGHRVTALYEIVPIDSPMEIDSKLKYQNTELSDSGELLTVSIRYKAPDSDTSSELDYPVKSDAVHSEMSENMKFACAVAETGMLLRSSEYSGNASYENIADLLNSIPDIGSDSDKLEFLLLVRKLSEMNYSKQ